MKKIILSLMVIAGCAFGQVVNPTVEEDPYWAAVSNDVITKANNGQTAFSWGNHATAGYLTAESDTLQTVVNRGNNVTNTVSVNQLNLFSKLFSSSHLYLLASNQNNMAVLGILRTTSPFGFGPSVTVVGTNHATSSYRGDIRIASGYNNSQDASFVILDNGTTPRFEIFFEDGRINGYGNIWSNFTAGANVKIYNANHLAPGGSDGYYLRRENGTNVWASISRYWDFSGAITQDIYNVQHFGWRDTARTLVSFVGKTQASTCTVDIIESATNTWSVFTTNGSFVLTTDGIKSTTWADATVDANKWCGYKIRQRGSGCTNIAWTIKYIGD